MSPEIPADRAVIDRVVDGVAVLLVGPKGSVTELDAAADASSASEVLQGWPSDVTDGRPRPRTRRG